MKFTCKLTVLALAIASLAACGGESSSQSLLTTPSNPSTPTAPVTQTPNTPTPTPPYVNPPNIPDNGGIDDVDTSATQSLTGMISTGDVFTGTVYVIDSNGHQTQRQVKEQHDYYIKVRPADSYLIKAVSSVDKNPNDTWRTLYSYAHSPRANITELTTYALNAMTPQKRLTTVFDNWQTEHSNYDVNTVNQIAKNTLADFAGEFQQAGLTNVPNIFTSQFKNDSTGMDKVLESINLFLMCTGDTCMIDGKSDGKLQNNERYSADEIKDKLLNVFSNLEDLDNLTLWRQETTVKTLDYDPASSGLPPNAKSKVVTNLSRPSSQAEFCEFFTKQPHLSSTYQVVDCEYKNKTGTFSIHRSSDIRTITDHTMSFENLVVSLGNSSNVSTPPYATVTRITKENGVEVATKVKHYENVTIPTDETSFCAETSTSKYAFVPLTSSYIYPVEQCSYTVENKKGSIVLGQNGIESYVYVIDFIE